jgi:hypothetical protein
LKSVAAAGALPICSISSSGSANGPRVIFALPADPLSSAPSTLLTPLPWRQPLRKRAYALRALFLSIGCLRDARRAADRVNRQVPI